MAKVILDSTDTQYTIANNNVEVKGASGSQTLVVNSGVTGLSFDSTIEDVDFSGNVADYTFSQNGAGDLTVHDSSGTAIATISGANGKTLSFADGTVALETTFDAGTGTGGVNLGGTAVGTTSAAVVPTTIDATDTSSNSGSTPTTGQSFTLTTGDDTNIFGTAGDDTYTATQSTYTANDLIIDSTTTDSDTLTVTATDDITLTPTVTGIENINFNLEAFSTPNGTATTFDIAADNIAASTINLDVTQAGSTISDGDVTAVKSGTTIAYSSDFTTGQVTGVDNSQLTINTAATDFTDLTVAGATVDDVTINASGKVTLTASSNDGDLTVVAAGDTTITDADAAAGAVSITSTGKLNIDGLEAAKTVTLSGAGTGATKSDWTEGDNTAALVTLNASGNAAAHEINLATGDFTALKTVNFTGDQDIKVSVSGADIDGGAAADKLTVTDSTTAGTTTLDFNTVGTVDTSNIAADVISFSADWAGDTITVASGQTIDFTVDQSATAAVTASSTTAATNTATINLANDSSDTAAVDATLTTTNIKTVTINALDDDTKNVITALNVGATNDVVVNAAAKQVEFATSITANKLTLNATTGTAVDLSTLGATTLKELDASGSSDAVTVTTGSSLVTLAGGSAADTVTATDHDITFDGNGGNDIFDASTIDFSNNQLTLTDVEIIHADNGADFKSSLLSGTSLIVTDTTTSATVTVVADNATVNLGTTTVDATKILNLAIDATALAVAGTALNITGTAAVDTVDATGATNTVTLDLGAGNDVVTATGTGNDSITLGEGNDTVTTSGTGNDTIDLGAGDDIVTTAGAGNDTITAGEGSDTIVGDAGADTIDLTETTSAIDYVTFNALTDGSSAGAGGGTFSGFDVVTGFTTGTDKFIFDGGDKSNGTTIDTGLGTTLGAAVVNASTAGSTDAIDLAVSEYTDVNAVLAFFQDVLGSNSTTGDSIQVVTFDDFSAIYSVADGGDAIAATEISLLGTVDEVVVSSDFVVA